MTRPPEPPVAAAGGSGQHATRLLLRPSIEVYPAASGELFLTAPGEPGLVVRDPDAADRLILEHLAAGASSTELAAHVRDAGHPVTDGELEAKLAALTRVGVAVERAESSHPLPAERRERFDRQLPYFLEAGDAEAAQLALARSRVLVLGCGGLGSWTLAGLAAAGVGSFVLVDPDRVDRSNLNRQILFGEADLGRPKVDCARRWVERFDATIEVRTVPRAVTGPGDLTALLPGVDAVVMAADSPPYDVVRWTDEACVDAVVPYVTAGQVPPLLKVGPTYLPGETGCFACHERAMRAEHPHYDALVRWRQARPAVATTLGSASGIVGELVALEVTHLLVGRRPLATEGRARFLDMRTLETRWEGFDRDPACPRCGHLESPAPAPAAAGAGMPR